jgi:hypothetical protein
VNVEREWMRKEGRKMGLGLGSGEEAVRVKIVKNQR